MDIHRLLQEHDVAIDDIRWYLALTTAERFLSYQEVPEELALLIWRGTIADELYEMEERWLSLQNQKLSDGRLDEAGIRELIREIKSAAERRPLS
ncbi:hypothetical protein Spith_1236 [Spirochaeta thermophila DSM 6578]|uniref:Uncharacterized protein n=1 Tax=Winmispira thermophila (strain ATCC 700085 / DSM 6578 / Z-1203) TaxID=869211 RepID=G0GEU6_WINT7|nr:hypothetical protein [Spirochaeta thermophila]AEJ61502.1 hypothetical protein Spith_1236 [Spirochaeta thermophila DSM 6578]